MTGGYFSGLVVVAGIAGIHLVYACMAGGAGHLTLAPMVKREGVLVQGCRPPGVGGVTVFAARPKITGMDGGFLVAASTFCGRAAVHVIFMAAGAVDGGVLTGEGEDGLVGETFQAVDTVVAGQAVRPKLGQVIFHERLGLVGVAGDAGRGGGGTRVTRMAGSAV